MQTAKKRQYEEETFKPAVLSNIRQAPMEELTDEILIKASNGDLKSFEIVYKATSGFVYNVAYRVLYNKQDAEEVTQEVFLSVYNKLKEFRFRSAFKTWVYRIAVNYAINRAKKNSNEKSRRKQYYENLSPEETSSGPAAGEGDNARIVDSYLKDLNPDQRACVVLRNIEGLSYRQIADSLRVNINTVRSRLKRARRKLLDLRKEAGKNEL